MEAEVNGINISSDESEDDEKEVKEKNKNKSHLKRNQMLTS